MLKFVFKIAHHDTTEIESTIWKDEMKTLSNHAQNIMITLKAKNRILILEIMIKYQNKKEDEEKKRENESKIKKEDLVLIKDKIKNNQKRRKLDVRWKKLKTMMIKIKHDLNA